jgi:glycosyltransferase involved in cell wall biosynthesis
LSPTNRKLRIAICGIRGIPHTYSGHEAWCLQLAPRLVERGHEVVVYCRRSLFRERPKFYKGVRLIYLPSIESKVLGQPTHTFFCMLDVVFRRVDVIVVANVANTVLCIIPRLLGKCVAINVDGLEWKRDKWGPIGKRFFYWSARIVGKICPKGVYTDAYEMHRIYLEEFRTPSACLTPGASIDTSINPEVVRQYGLEPLQYYLIASRLVPENNAHLIVRAFEETRSRRLLAIAGDANYRSDFVERLRQTKDPRVRFLGHVANVEHVKELHCNAYAYIHGHSMGGTNPALLKALGYGNCVLALNTPFNSEVLQDYGVLFEQDPADLAAKIEYLENNPTVADEFRRRAPQRIRGAYSWEHITDQHEELFLQLASGQDPSLIHSSVTNHPEARERTEAFLAATRRERK